MENPSTTLVTTEQNPFERLRRTSDNGGSYWSARELMPLLGYELWRNLASILTNRVIPSLENQEKPSLSHIAEVANMVERDQGGGRTLQDFHISRLAAYLLAMNGDPRKPEIAAAQHYFAARTRQSEIAPAPTAMTRREILELALEAERKAEELQARAIEDAPKVEAFEKLMDASGTMSLSQVAKTLGTGVVRLCATLRDASVLMHDQPNWNVPYQRHVDAGRFEIKASSVVIDGETRRTLTTRVTTRGLEYIRRLLEKESAA